MINCIGVFRWVWSQEVRKGGWSDWCNQGRPLLRGFFKAGAKRGQHGKIWGSELQVRGTVGANILLREQAKLDLRDREKQPGSWIVGDCDGVV